MMRTPRSKSLLMNLPKRQGSHTRRQGREKLGCPPVHQQNFWRTSTQEPRFYHKAELRRRAFALDHLDSVIPPHSTQRGSTSNQNDFTLSFSSSSNHFFEVYFWSVRFVVDSTINNCQIYVVVITKDPNPFDHKIQAFRGDP